MAKQNSTLSNVASKMGTSDKSTELEVKALRFDVKQIVSDIKHANEKIAEVSENPRAYAKGSLARLKERLASLETMLAETNAKLARAEKKHGAKIPEKTEPTPKVVKASKTTLKELGQAANVAAISETKRGRGRPSTVEMLARKQTELDAAEKAQAEILASSGPRTKVAREAKATVDALSAEVEKLQARVSAIAEKNTEELLAETPVAEEIPEESTNDNDTPKRRGRKSLEERLGMVTREIAECREILETQLANPETRQERKRKKDLIEMIKGLEEQGVELREKIKAKNAKAEKAETEKIVNERGTADMSIKKVLSKEKEIATKAARRGENPEAAIVETRKRRGRPSKAEMAARETTVNTASESPVETHEAQNEREEDSGILPVEIRRVQNVPLSEQMVDAGIDEIIRAIAALPQSKMENILAGVLEIKRRRNRENSETVAKETKRMRPTQARFAMEKALWNLCTTIQATRVISEMETGEIYARPLNINNRLSIVEFVDGPLVVHKSGEIKSLSDACKNVAKTFAKFHPAGDGKNDEFAE